MSAACPVCDRPGNGLLCDGIYVNGRDVSCTGHLERELGDVASLVNDLDIALSKQARIGNSGVAGLARERTPINVGAMDPRWVLENVLTTWVRDLTGDDWRPGLGVSPSIAAAGHMLMLVNEMRRHPAVEELVDEVTDAIWQARRAVDRPSDRAFVGPCNTVVEGVMCVEDLYARRGASEVRCKVCSAEHDVSERRAWLLDQARDRLFTVREAAQMMGDVGGIKVTEASIRGYIHRQRLAYHPIGTGKGIRLGDLLAVLLNESERRSA